jgi:lipid A disaccharide synthetase
MPIQQTDDGTLQETYHTVADIAVPAAGAIQFTMMLYLRPSIASERVNPMIAAFAVQYCETQIQII